MRHAIEAHSFSAQVTPRTREAMVVQNTDRLDALGAVGIARCLMLGGAMGRPLYDPAEPFPDARTPDDTANVLDHLYVKLLHISSTITTAAGQAEVHRRMESRANTCGNSGGRYGPTTNRKRIPEMR